jgi:Protein of unknown function (DUF4232)
MRSSLPLATALAAALVLAGCGGSTSASQTTTGAGGANPTAPAPSSTASPPTTATTTQAVSPTTATSSICRAADLSASFLGGQAATGHGLLGFALHNVSDHTCTSFGYPGVQFLAKSGRALPTVPTHTTQDYFGPLPKAALTVAPGATISFRLGVTHGAATTAGCATAWALQVIPPNDTSTLRIGLPNGAYECQATTVSPVQTGTSAYP